MTLSPADEPWPELPLRIARRKTSPTTIKNAMKQPKADLFAASLLGVGAPQFGHFSASVETSRPQSLHLMSAIAAQAQFHPRPQITKFSCHPLVDLLEWGCGPGPSLILNGLNG